MAKVLVTGALGQLGNELKTLAPQHTSLQFEFIDLADLDLTEERAVKAFLADGAFDFVVNCAAYTAVDKAEDDEDTARKVNADAVRYLAQGCEAAGSVLFQISTDFVFGHGHGKPLTEEDTPAPLGVYGLTKWEGEQQAARHCTRHYILRTSWLYSTFGGNFVKTMLRLGRERGKLGVINDQIGTPTYARDLAEVMVLLMFQHGDQPAPYGTYHFSNEGAASWYDFAHAIFDLAGVEVELGAIPTSAYPTPAERPSYSLMSKAKIKETLSIALPHWRERLAACLAELEK